MQQDILADDGAGGQEERRKRLFKGLKFFFGREVRSSLHSTGTVSARHTPGDFLPAWVVVALTLKNFHDLTFSDNCLITSSAEKAGESAGKCEGKS